MALPWLRVVVGLVALTMVALAAYPLALFALDGLNSITLEAKAAGDRVIYELHYNGSIPLADATLQITLLGRGGEVLASNTTHTPKLAKGGTIEVELPAGAHAIAETIQVSISGKIAGVYSFTLNIAKPTSTG